MAASPAVRRIGSREVSSSSPSPSLGGPPSATSIRTNRGGSFITKYFLVILFLFACLSLLLNSRVTHVAVQDASTLESYLENSVQSLVKPLKEFPKDVRLPDGVEDPEDTPEQLDGNDELEPMLDSNPHAHRVAGLHCEKWGGPSVEIAQEMVYWEDIPSDAEWISPFHRKGNGPTQYMTFEPDQGGWNNIRMAMETVLVSKQLVLYYIKYTIICTVLCSGLTVVHTVHIYLTDTLGSSFAIFF